MLSPVDRRQPQALVQFIGTELHTVAPQQLVAVRTMKALGQPAGVFEVTLKAGFYESSRNFTINTDGTAPVDDAYWLRVLKPMTLCVIAFGTDQEIKGVAAVVGDDLVTGAATRTGSSQPPELREAIKKNVVMLGVVDAVALDTQVTAGGVMRTVRVTGRDMTRLLLDDTLKRFINTPEDRMIAPLGRDITVTSEDGRALWDRAHVNVSADGTAPAWFPLERTLDEAARADLTLKEFYAGVIAAAPSLRLKLPNGKRAGDYLRTLDLDPTLEYATTVVQSLTRILFWNQPAWQLMQDLAPRPMIECFVDTVGLEAHLVVRRPPFSRPQAMPGFDALALELAERSSSSASQQDLVRAMLAPALVGMPTKDMMAEGPLRVSAGGHHTVPSRDIMMSSFTRSAGESFSMYQALDINQSLPSGEVEAALSAILYDLPAAARFGTSMLQVLVPHGIRADAPGMPPRSRPPAPTPVKPPSQGGAERSKTERGTPAGATQRTAPPPFYAVDSNRALNVIEAVRAYYFFRDNPEYLNGTVVMRGRPEVRIGDRVRLPDHGDLLFYVEAVDQTYQFGQPYVTRLTLSRGQPFQLTARLGQWDTDPPLLTSLPAPARPPAPAPTPKKPAAPEGSGTAALSQSFRGVNIMPGF